MALEILKPEDQLNEALNDMRTAVARTTSDIRFWEELARSNARAHNKVEDERFALLQENKRLKAQLELAEGSLNRLNFISQTS